MTTALESNWIQYAPQRGARTTNTINIGKTGRVGFPSYFIAKHGITRKKSHAVLFCNTDVKTIAIALTDSTANHRGFSLTFTQKNSAYIRTATFFADFHLDPAHFAGRYEYEQIKAKTLGIPDVETVFVVKLEDHHKAGEHSE